VFDELNFSEALKALWTLVAETDGYLTANAPWKRPTDRPEAEHVALQARVLATAAEAIRIITALVYPILPESAAKVWLQLGQGDISAAARSAFLTNIAWGGLKAGTKFGEPAPLFPRAEKDAIDRMQNIEDKNSSSAIEAAATCGAAGGGSASEPSAATASPSVASTALANTAEERAKEDALTPTTAVSPEQGVATARVDAVPAHLTSARLSTAPVTEPAAGSPATAQTAVAGQPADSAAAPQAAPTAELITIDDFVKVDLRVAQILVAERIPKADKLLRLEVDLGYEKRQILAGIAQFYTPEQLVGRKIVIVANLAPRKMRGLESNGMLLAASLPDGAPVLAGFLEGVPLGARLK
jgi:methionyl-tRNA synthetase